MNYDKFKRSDPAPFFPKGKNWAKVDDIKSRFPLEVWQKIASYCDYKTLETFEHTMFQKPGQPLLWYYLERPFSKAVSSMNPVRPMPPFGRLCRRGLPQETLDRISLRDANRLATSLSPKCQSSFLYLQVNSEKYKRPLMQFSNAVNEFLEAARPFHSNRNGAGVPREAPLDFLLRVASFSQSVVQLEHYDQSREKMANIGHIFDQIKAGQEVCEAFKAYWTDEATRWLRAGHLTVDFLSDVDFRTLETKAESYAKALGLSADSVTTAS
jgi:hypothetical protein